MSAAGIFLLVVATGSVLTAVAGLGLRRYGRGLADDRAPASAEHWIDAVTVQFVLLAWGGVLFLVGQLPGAEGTARAVGVKIGFVLLGLGVLYLAAVVLLARVAGRGPSGTPWWPGRGSTTEGEPRAGPGSRWSSREPVDR